MKTPEEEYNCIASETLISLRKREQELVDSLQITRAYIKANAPKCKRCGSTVDGQHFGIGDSDRIDGWICWSCNSR